MNVELPLSIVIPVRILSTLKKYYFLGPCWLRIAISASVLLRCLEEVIILGKEVVNMAMR